MLNFDEDRFLRIQSGAVAQAAALRKAIDDELANGATNLVFLGSGGAGILLQPAFRLLQAHSTFPVYAEMPAELVATGSLHIGDSSIVVIASLSGTTSESVAALEWCKARGARVVSLTGHADTPLASGADVSVVNFAEDDTSCESFYLQSLLIALAVMAHRGEITDYDAVVEQLERIPALLLEVKRRAEEQAPQLAQTFAASSYHIFTGAGSTWPEAFYYAMCILEEMQWIRTRPVHASDFFHGTLELVEPGVSVVVLRGEDESRPLADRVEAFAARYTDQVTVLDSAAYELPGISERVRGLLSPVVLATVLERVSAHLEVLRDHPLTTRRYYKRVAY